MLTSAAITQQALQLGFDLCGIAPAAAYPELAFYREWIEAGYAGDMQYLARTTDKRCDLQQVVPGVRSVIALATNYHTDRPYSTEIADRGEALIARYAWGDDYHDVITARLDALIAWMRERDPRPFEARRYVDTGPVQERIVAYHAGLGWLGKNTCLIHPEIGSWLFLSVILTTLDLEPGIPEPDHCGTCTLCLDACPTQAFVAPHVLDARRCLSYVTIEQKGAIPDDLRDALGSHVYGCDICQEVCPFNQAPPISLDPAWQPRPAFDRPQLAALRAMPDDALRAAMKGSPMKRSGVKGLRRTLAAIADDRAPMSLRARPEEES